MGVLLQRSFSTVVLLGLLAGALWWDCELGYYGLVCIFCILAAWEWRHMLLRSGKASQPNLSFLFGVAYPVLLSWSCCITKFRESALAEQVSFLIPLPLLVALAAPVLLVVVAFIREMKHPVDGSRALRSVGTTLLSFIYPVWLFSFAILALHLAYMRAGCVYPAIVMCVLWVVLVTKMADIFAYVSGFLLGGRLFSRRLIPPHQPQENVGGPPRFLGADECGGHRAGFPDVQNFRLVHNPGTGTDGMHIPHFPAFRLRGSGRVPG